ncbi:hypothetical protein ACIA5C_45915 [Actinoplanes sp. NPDC051343]|uniref:hypothetical protein n=1 Tax=Actinoplanes sp. NPDC051343 TaxID=3363906 RepID=UPI0037970079
MSQSALDDRVQGVDEDPPEADAGADVDVDTGQPPIRGAVYAMVAGILITAAARGAAKLASSADVSSRWGVATGISTAILLTIIAGCASGYVLGKLRRGRG